MNSFLKTILMALATVHVSGNADQLQELRRQYAGYREVFNKVEKPQSFEMFVENLNRIANRRCDYFVDKTSDEELTHTDCFNKMRK
jgi:hypothetical protein